MRALVQRVTSASVSVDEKVVGSIQRGILVLLGVKQTDTPEICDWVAEKCIHLRIFPDDQGRFNHSVLDIKGEVLVVSQFTLYGDCRRGRRPDFTQAAEPTLAESLYQRFIHQIQLYDLPVASGIFGAKMMVHLVNDGPVTVMIEKES